MGHGNSDSTSSMVLSTDNSMQRRRDQSSKRLYMLDGIKDMKWKRDGIYEIPVEDEEISLTWSLLEGSLSVLSLLLHSLSKLFSHSCANFSLSLPTT